MSYLLPRVENENMNLTHTCRTRTPEINKTSVTCETVNRSENPLQKSAAHMISDTSWKNNHLTDIGVDISIEVVILH